MSNTNTAAWLMAKQQRPFQVAEAPMPALKNGQVLIKVHAVAINPCDAGIQKLGFIWEEYPVIIGSDLAGEVVQVGTGVNRLQEGDRVLACVENGAFQQYCVADVELVAKVPENTSYTQAAVLPLAIATAANSLFHPNNMALEMPHSKPGSNGIVLVWGASSSVGSCGVQMLRGAGYQVAATAGASNAQYCKDLGVGYVFDHKNPEVEQEIVKAISTSGLKFAGVFSAIADKDVLATCLRIAGQLGEDEKSRVVGTVIPPDMPMFPLPEVPSGLRLGFCTGGIDFLPESKSKLRGIFGYEMQPLTGIGPAIFEEWLPAALETGVLKCKPDPLVVGHGLEKIQQACDLMDKGVSATKLVVELV